MDEFCNKLVFESSDCVFIVTMEDLRKLKYQISNWSEKEDDFHSEVFFQWKNYPQIIAFRDLSEAQRVLEEGLNFYQEYPHKKYWLGITLTNGRKSATNPIGIFITRPSDN